MCQIWIRSQAYSHACGQTLTCIIILSIIMYRGTPYLNRNIKKREEIKSMEYHLNNLYHIRPRTSTMEHTNEIQINNRKKQLQKEVRFTQIERENRILLNKISTIMGKSTKRISLDSTQKPKNNKSLNGEYRRRQLQNIQVENAKLLKRLQQRKPNYETHKLRENWRKQKSVIQNLSNYPLVIDPDGRKRSSFSQIGSRALASRSSYTRPNDKVQIHRLRVIDGVTLMVTVKLTAEKLQIIGDTREGGQIKVIEIDRAEAMAFINHECQGRIEKIFNCLRYNQNSGVMYLVGQGDSQEEDLQVDNDHSSLSHNTKEVPPQCQNETDCLAVQGGNGVRPLWVEVMPKKDSQKLIAVEQPVFSQPDPLSPEIQKEAQKSVVSAKLQKTENEREERQSRNINEYLKQQNREQNNLQIADVMEQVHKQMAVSEPFVSDQAKVHTLQSNNGDKQVDFMRKPGELLNSQRKLNYQQGQPDSQQGELNDQQEQPESQQKELSYQQGQPQSEPEEIAEENNDSQLQQYI